jgi:23S rRNA pseudouridine1911/1915/1917 synthase
MKHIGQPLFNDLEYGGDKILKGTRSTSYTRFIENCFELIPGQALHAKTLGFFHPVLKKHLQFDSTLPYGFQSVIEKWEKYVRSED